MTPRRLVPLLEGTAAGSLGPADLEDMGFDTVAVDLLELAVSPGLEVIAAAGGLGGFTGWRGTILALARPAAVMADLEPAGWRARRPPTLVSEQDDEVVLRSSIDGSLHHLTASGLARAALDLGGAPLRDVLPRGCPLSWWEDGHQPVPGAGWVVSSVPANAGRAGRYWAGEGWSLIADVIDAAAGGPLVDGCACVTCTSARAGYIAHLWGQREITAAHLLGRHNLHQARLLVEG